MCYFASFLLSVDEIFFSFPARNGFSRTENSYGVQAWMIHFILLNLPNFIFRLDVD